MATRQFLMTYDDEEHYDIHQFLNSVPRTQKSKYVRIAIQEYLRTRNMNQEPVAHNNSKSVQLPSKRESIVQDENPELVDIDPSFFDLGL